MSACKADFHREKAVRTSAELLRDSGIAFFPLDIRRLLKNSFSHQIKLIPYKELGEISLKESADGITDPRTLSKDGFCMRVRDVLIDLGTGPVTSNIWNIYYNESSLQERIRFTLLHELGHVFLGHHQLLGMDSTAGMESMPEYREADNQADQFSINALAPAPAVARLLREHGFSCMKNGLEWRITNRNAPFLQNLGQDPDPVQLIMTAFQISRAAAATRLRELKSELQIWQQLDPELYACIEGISHRSGWYCWVCSTRRRTASAYCPGCGRAGRMNTKTLDGHPGRSWGFAEMASLSSALYAATPAFLRTLLTALYAAVRSSMNAKTHAIQTETLFAAECMLSGARTGAGLRIFTAENVGY